MKCEEAQLILLSFEGDERMAEQDRAILHAQQCRECAELVSFDKRLTTTLESEDVRPAHLMADIRHAIAKSQPQPSLPWITKFGRSTLMKKIALSAAFIAVATALTATLLTRPAYAADARDKFASMKKAVLGSSKPSKHNALRAKLTAEGAVASWSLVGGKVDDLVPGKTVFIDASTGAITQPDMSSLPPDVQEEIRKANERHERDLANGNAAQVYINGEPATMEEAQRHMREAGLNIEIKFELEESSYQSIAFGGNQDTLVLTPKTKRDERFVVQIDSKTNLPSRILLERQTDGKWQPVNSRA